MKLNIIFHSIHSHVWRMAEAVAEGAKSVAGADKELQLNYHPE